MGLNFGDLLSNALHEVKLHTRKKIGIIQDEIGYTFDPPLTGVTIESWRYRKPPSALPDLEQLAVAIIDYGSSAHDESWLRLFLESGGHPFPEAVCQRLFPTENPSELEPQNAPKKPTNYPPPHISAYRPPHLDTFIGREVELARFQKELDETNLALICGMAGMGKTTLANQLARLNPNQKTIFWHPFHDGNLNPFIRRLAGFLANHGRSDLWDMIEAARLNGVKPPDIETSFDTLVAQLEGTNVTLCLDDLQYVDEDPQFADLLTRIQKSDLKLVITARRFPSFINSQRHELDGLSLADAGQLLGVRQVELTDELVSDLHRYTAGNGAFLTLAAVMLRHAANPADLISKLATIDNIERFLMEEVNDRLSANQQRVMEGVAILGGYPGSRDALEEILNQRDVRRTLQELSSQFLLLVGEGEFGREYSQHSIIQSFYYEQPRQRIRRQLHLRAAEFYEFEEVDRFKAAFHFAKGDQSERATRLASIHLWEIVNQGMAKPLANILDGIQEGNLAQTDLFELWLAQAQLDTLLGDVDNAQEVLQKAADRLQELPQSAETDVLKGRVCLHMAELLERQSPPDALTWAQRGLEVAPRGETELTAALNIRAGTMMMHMGNIGGALETFDIVEVEKLDQDPQLKTELWMNLSALHTNHANSLDQAYQFGHQALELSQQLRNHLQTARIYPNLAYIHYAKGDWHKAAVALEEAMGIAKRLGSQTEILSISVNLGRMYIDLGELTLARKLLEQAISMGGHLNLHQASIAKINMGSLFIIEEKFERALELLAEAKPEFITQNDQMHLGMISMSIAEAKLGQNKLKQAEAEAEHAVKLFKSLGNNYAEGIALRIKGQVWVAQEKLAEANHLFDQSIQYLENADVFQNAITLAHKGFLASKLEKQQESHLFLGKAVEVFEKVGATLQVKWIKRHLSSVASI